MNAYGFMYGEEHRDHVVSVLRLLAGRRAANRAVEVIRSLAEVVASEQELGCGILNTVAAEMSRLVLGDSVPYVFVRAIPGNTWGGPRLEVSVALRRATVTVALVEGDRVGWIAPMVTPSGRYSVVPDYAPQEQGEYNPA